MASQPELFHESLNDALREVVQALGGPKRVGAAMRPEKSPDEAGRWVLDCLNADRREHFHPDQVLWLLREGRRIGCHAGARFMNREAGYAEPVPIDPSDQKQKLVETIQYASEQLKSAVLVLERIEKGTILSLVPRQVA